MNGRVDILDNFNFNMYKMYDENAVKSSFSQEAVKHVHTNNELSNIFFSDQNIDVLQDAIRYLVHEKTCGKFTISRQSDTELKLIMRAMYLQEGRHRQYDVLEEVKALNVLVLNYAVPRITQEIQMYMQYKKDISALPVPMERGDFSSSKGTRQLIQKEF